MNRFCRAAVVVFALLYLAALGVFIVGTLGLFGSERDPLSGVFLIPLGIPWIWAIDQAPQEYWPWLSAAAPIVNLVLLGVACRLTIPKRPV